MSDTQLYFLMLVLPGSILLYFIGSLIYALWYDKKNPPKPIYYTWRRIWPDYKGDWERGNCTHVYINPENNSIRGKVVKQTDGLYRATMWNGAEEDFIMEHEAIKSVEEYKPKVYK